MEMDDEIQDLESRIQAICKTIEENPKEARYLLDDLHYFEEELQLLRIKDNLRTLKQAKRRIGDKADTRWDSKRKGGCNG